MRPGSPPIILGPVAASLPVIGERRPEPRAEGPNGLLARVLVAAPQASPILARLDRHALCRSDRLQDRAVAEACASKPDLVVVLAHDAQFLAPAAHAVQSAQRAGALAFLGFAPAEGEPVPELLSLSRDLGCAVILCDPALGALGLADLAAAPIESIGEHGLIGIDFADLRRLMEGMATGVFTEVSLPAPVAADLTELGHFLVERLPAATAGLWLHLRGGPALKLSELSRVTEAVARAAPADANLCFASTIGPDLATLELCVMALVRGP